MCVVLLILLRAICVVSFCASEADVARAVASGHNLDVTQARGQQQTAMQKSPDQNSFKTQLARHTDPAAKRPSLTM
jgi:hypothetical protein